MGDGQRRSSRIWRSPSWTTCRLATPIRAAPGCPRRPARRAGRPGGSRRWRCSVPGRRRRRCAPRSIFGGRSRTGTRLRRRGCRRPAGSSNTRVPSFLRASASSVPRSRAISARSTRLWWMSTRSRASSGVSAPSSSRCGTAVRRVNTGFLTAVWVTGSKFSRDSTAGRRGSDRNATGISRVRTHWSRSGSSARRRRWPGARRRLPAGSRPAPPSGPRGHRRP